MILYIMNLCFQKVDRMITVSEENINSASFDILVSRYSNLATHLTKLKIST